MTGVEAPPPPPPPPPGKDPPHDADLQSSPNAKAAAGRRNGMQAREEESVTSTIETTAADNTTVEEENGGDESNLPLSVPRTGFQPTIDDTSAPTRRSLSFGDVHGPGAYRVQSSTAFARREGEDSEPEFPPLTTLARASMLQPSPPEPDDMLMVQATLVEDMESREEDSGSSNSTQTAAGNRDNEDEDGDEHSAINIHPEVVIHNATPESKFVRRYRVAGRTISINILVVAAVCLILVMAIAISVTVTKAKSRSVDSDTNLLQLTREGAAEILSPAVTELDLLLDLTAPQGRAFQWLVEEDQFYIHPENQEKIVQRFVLALLYFSIGGIESDVLPHETEQMIGPVDECEWMRVKCYPGMLVTSAEEDNVQDENQGRVFEVDLSYAGLSGSLPSEIGHLSSLVRLYFTGNRLGGSIPSSIGNLTQMEELSIHQNQLTSTIPSEIGNLSNMYLLLASRNNLTGTVPQTLKNIPHLVWLFFDDNDLTGDLDFMCDGRPYIYFISDCDSDNLTCSCCSFCG